ncbi:hypothetical protein NL676_028414 [Syzygium grande]|nr:hypothetical protein NL676_028414 [Syzygium grande]
MPQVPDHRITQKKKKNLDRFRTVRKYIPGGDDFTGREKSSLVGGARGSGLGGSIVEELPEARLDEVAASFGAGLLRSDVGVGEVDAGPQSGWHQRRRRRSSPPVASASHYSIASCRSGALEEDDRVSGGLASKKIKWFLFVFRAGLFPKG